MLNVKFKNMSKVKIILNGEEKILDQAMSVADLVRILELDVKKIAVEKDSEIVNPDQFSEVILDEGSRVEIVHFIGGG
jgi:sulfur carrier protein